MPPPHRPARSARPQPDSLEQHQGVLLQRILAVLLGVNLLGIVFAITTPGIPSAVQTAILSSVGFMTLVCVLSRYLLRRARFLAGLTSLVLGLLLAITGLLIPQGLQSSWIAFFVLIYPITIAGLVGHRRLLWGTVLLSSTSIAALGILEVQVPWLVGFRAPEADFQLAAIVSFGSLVSLLGLVIDAFGRTLRTALTQAQQQAQDLDALRLTQDQTIQERTAALSAALDAGTQREAQLQQALAALTASQHLIRTLRAPFIPVLPGVLVVPLVGALDPGQLDGITQRLLTRVQHERISSVILDLTGLADLNPDSAPQVLALAAATRLLGGQVLVAGIRPDSAQTLIMLQQPLEGLHTFATLHQAIRWLLARHNRER